MFTDLLFYEIQQVRILVFDIYQRCPMPLNSSLTIHFVGIYIFPESIFVLCLICLGTEVVNISGVDYVLV